MSLLALDGVSVDFDGRLALNGVSLEIAAGEIVALVGESGSGKSTLALAALGLLPPSARQAGCVRIDGRDLAGLDAGGLGDVRGGRIGMVFQDPASALNPALTIGRQIGEVLARHTDLDRPAIKRRVVDLLYRVGLDVEPTRHPHALSGGQRQRVAIAMGVAADPALLIADEPTAALDPIAQRRIVDLLVGLVRERGMALLLVTHDLALACEVADRIAVLADGRLVEQGDAKTLLATPQSPELRAQRDAARAVPASWPRRDAANLVQATGLSRIYRGVPALIDADFAIRREETLGVIGESGSGKSTLARIVLGLDRPDGGTVTIDGASYASLSRRDLYRRMQAVFQDPATSFDPRWTVGDIVAEPLHLLDARPSRAERDARVAEALAAVGLPEDAASRRPHQFSGGQRQRIAIARALILKPALVVLDEALSALDARVRSEIVALLAHLQAEHGLAYLFVSHDIGLVRAIADRVIVLRHGRIIAAGPAGELLDAPSDPYLATLAAAQPRLT